MTYIDEPSRTFAESRAEAKKWISAGKPAPKPIGPATTTYDRRRPAPTPTSFDLPWWMKQQPSPWLEDPWAISDPWATPTPPTPIGELTPDAKQITQTPEYLELQNRRLFPELYPTEPEATPPPGLPEWMIAGEPPPFPTESTPEGYHWEWDGARYVAAPDPTTKPPTTYEQRGEVPTDQFGREATWNERLGQWDYPPNWGVDPKTQDWAFAPPPSQYQAGQLGLQEQQLRLQQQMAIWQQQQARQEALAKLAAQPRSWLEYHALAGTTPTVQPWMAPLMPQEYGLGVGQPIPGITPEGMGGMPALTRPSRQYQARMGPTAMGQYEGYRQARTGLTPEETQWRMWATAPPGGQYGGLSYAR